MSGTSRVRTRYAANKLFVMGSRPALFFGDLKMKLGPATSSPRDFLQNTLKTKKKKNRVLVIDEI
jgi:hypothetical protein